MSQRQSRVIPILGGGGQRPTNQTFDEFDKLPERDDLHKGLEDEDEASAGTGGCEN